MLRFWILGSYISSALALAVVLVGCASCRSAQTASPPSVSSNEPSVVLSKRVYRKPSDDELRKSLTPLEYEVTQRDATEPPFQNAYWNNHAEGLYVDVATGEPLFSSRDKFDSGTGWPSFTRPAAADHLSTRTDEGHGMQRTEVRSRVGNSHLGHLFDDGPPPSHKRYCINSAALRFIPVDRLDAEGYGEYRSLFEKAANPSHVKSTNAVFLRAMASRASSNSGSRVRTSRRSSQTWVARKFRPGRDPAPAAIATPSTPSSSASPVT